MQQVYPDVLASPGQPSSAPTSFSVTSSSIHQYTYHVYLAYHHDPKHNESLSQTEATDGLGSSGAASFEDLPLAQKEHVDWASQIAREEEESLRDKGCLGCVRAREKRRRGAKMGPEGCLKHVIEVASDQGREWRTMNMPEPLFLDEVLGAGRSFVYLKPPKLSTSSPHLALNDTHFPVLVGSNLPSFAHASRRLSTSDGSPTGPSTRKNTTRRYGDLRLFHQTASLQPESPMNESGLTGGSDPSFSHLLNVMDQEVDDLPEFTYWDETLGIEKAEDEDNESESQSQQNLDLRRPFVAEPTTSEVIVGTGFDRTTITNITTQQDNEENGNDHSTESLASLLAPRTNKSDLTSRSTSSEQDHPITIPIAAATRSGKGVLKPMPLHLSGIDLPAFPNPSLPSAEILPGPGERGVICGRGRGGGVSRGGKRGGGAVNALARVKLADGGGGVEEVSSGGKERERRPLRAALSPFVLRSAEGKLQDHAENRELLEDQVVEASEMNPVNIPCENAAVGQTSVDSGDGTIPQLPEDDEMTTSETSISDDEVPSFWSRLQDLIPEPHTVPVNPSFEPDKYAVSEDFKFVPVPSNTPHPFHPRLQHLVAKNPHMRVKWIIPIEGEVTIPDLSKQLSSCLDPAAQKKSGQTVYAFVPVAGSLDLDASQRKADELAYISWTPAILLEFWDLLLRIRRIGRFGHISFALSGPQPTAYEGKHHTSALDQHAYLPADFQLPSTCLPPKKPRIGYHIKLFCDLAWALRLRLVISAMYLGTNGQYRQGSKADLKDTVPYKAFAFRKLCLLGERGEVLLVA